jgi:hypothetical protein
MHDPADALQRQGVVLGFDGHGVRRGMEWAPIVESLTFGRGSPATFADRRID